MIFTQQLHLGGLEIDFLLQSIRSDDSKWSIDSIFRMIICSHHPGIWRGTSYFVLEESPYSSLLNFEDIRNSFSEII